MASTTASSRRSILDLPNEILHQIAANLRTDRDILNLALSCAELHSRVLGPASSIWRSRFEARYDIVGPTTVEELCYQYRTRAIALSQKMAFRGRKVTEKEALWLSVVHTMLVESLTVPLTEHGPKTYNRLREVMAQAKFLSHPKKMKACEFGCAIQLCLTAFALHREVSEPCGRSEYELSIVYSFGTNLARPFITHTDLDLSKILHIRSFWQQHLLEPDELTFYSNFNELGEDRKPKMRKEYGAVESGLSREWVGYYSCLHPMPETRTKVNRNPRQTCADGLSHLSVEYMVRTEGEPFWPASFDHYMPMDPNPATQRIFFDGWQGTPGLEENENLVLGFAETIEYPYGRISGWTRVCFAIIASEAESQVPEWIHGYEALLLPGGRIMLGRWMDLEEPSGRGPFIFWDV